MNPVEKEIQIVSKSWHCASCDHPYSFDEVGKHYAENCCKCFECAIEKSSPGSSLCEKCYLIFEIKSLKYRMRQDSLYLESAEQQLKKLNESSKN